MFTVHHGFILHLLTILSLEIDAILLLCYFSDWQAMCVQLGELHQNGALSTEHVKVFEQLIVSLSGQ